MMDHTRGRGLRGRVVLAGITFGAACVLQLPRAQAQHAGHAAAEPAPGLSASQNAAAQKVRVVCLTQELKFDRGEFTVTAGKPVELTLVNPSDMPHNLLVCQKDVPDVHMAVATEAMQLPDAMERQYVPESPLVLFHTRLLNPGEEDTIRFEAPKEPGDYPYVCTIPGHAMTMWGVMHVVAEGQATAAATAGGHGHGSHASAEPHPHLRDVTYQYFEGDYSKLPDFNALSPKLAGVVPTGRIDVPSLPRKEYYGLVIKATLDVPRDGSYSFALRCDDGARVRVDGKNAVTFDGLHPASLRVGRPMQLTKGPHVLEVQYFNASTNYALQVAWSGPGLDEMQPLSSSKEGIDLNRFFLKVGDEPVVQRGLMPDSSPRSIAVGLPGGTNYCFDTEKGFVRYGWTGHFIDVGPQHGYGDGRGGNTMAVLGEQFGLGSQENPLRIGDAGKVPVVDFLGYERTPKGPKMLYSVDGAKVSQMIEPANDQRGLQLTYEFESTPTAPVFFVLDPQGLEVASSAGEWEDGQLQLPPEAARRFSVTVVSPTP